MKEKTYSENWGGARKGAGKKPTGRKKVNFYIDQNEEKILREQLEKYRSTGILQPLEKRPPNSKDDNTENQKSKLVDKIKYDFEIAIQSAAGCSMTNIFLTKAETLGELLGISNAEVVKKISAATEQQSKDNLFKQEKIEDIAKHENNHSISKYNYHLPRNPIEAENKKAVNYDKYESKNHLKRIKKHPRYKHPALIELRGKYRYTATLRAVVYKENKIYVWFSPKSTKTEEIFRVINGKSQIYGMLSKEIFDIFGYKDSGYVPELKI